MSRLLAFGEIMLRLSLNATNLFDRRGYASCLVRGDCFTNAPRNVMLSLRYGI